MTYIPDVREKKTISLYSKEETKNGYWQGYLDKAHADITRGWDFAVKDMMSGIETIDGTEGVFNQLGLTWLDIDEKIIASGKPVDDYTEEEIKAMSKCTRTILAVKELLEIKMECRRDEMVVSFIENMNEDEYEKLVKAADAGNYDNGLR